MTFKTKKDTVMPFRSLSLSNHNVHYYLLAYWTKSSWLVMSVKPKYFNKIVAMFDFFFITAYMATYKVSIYEWRSVSRDRFGQRTNFVLTPSTAVWDCWPKDLQLLRYNWVLLKSRYRLRLSLSNIHVWLIEPLYSECKFSLIQIISQ